MCEIEPLEKAKQTDALTVHSAAFYMPVEEIDICSEDGCYSPHFPITLRNLLTPKMRLEIQLIHQYGTWNCRKYAFYIYIECAH